VEGARNIEEKYDETSRTSTFVPIRYTDASRHGKGGKYNSFRRTVSLFAGRKLAISRERDRDILRAPFATFSRTLDSAYLFTDGASSSTLSPRIFSSCRIGNITTGRGAGRKGSNTQGTLATSARSTVSMTVSRVCSQLIKISLSNMKEVSGHRR